MNVFISQISYYLLNPENCKINFWCPQHFFLNVSIVMEVLLLVFSVLFSNNNCQTKIVQ